MVKYIRSCQFTHLLFLLFLSSSFPAWKFSFCHLLTLLCAAVVDLFNLRHNWRHGTSAFSRFLCLFPQFRKRSPLVASKERVHEKKIFWVLAYPKILLFDLIYVCVCVCPHNFCLYNVCFSINFKNFTFNQIFEYSPSWTL